MRPIRTTIRYVLTVAVWLSVIGFFNSAAQAQPEPAEWYVDDDAVDDNGSGEDWGDPFKTLQKAIDEAEASFGSDLIKIAQGEYKPTKETDPGDERSATFLLNAPDLLNVTIEGGYAGIGAPNPDLRDIEAFETILNGAFPAESPPGSCGGPETLDCLVANPGVPGCQDPVCCEIVCLEDPLCCSAGLGWYEGCADLAWHVCPHGVYHVITIENVGNTVRLDGLTITGGSAADKGGGVLVRDAEPVIVGCRFKRNRADNTGGALHLVADSLLLVEPLVVNCAFLRNEADSQGGAVSVLGAQQGPGGEPPAHVVAPLFVNCVFSGNHAPEAGGLYSAISSRVAMVNCTLNRNEGGAVFIFSGIGGSGGVWLNNSIVWANESPPDLRLGGCQLQRRAGGVLWPGRRQREHGSRVRGRTGPGHAGGHGRR